MASWEEFSRIVAEAKSSKKLDPVGHEDDDVDNDGDSDSSDSYLKKRRAAVGAAIASDRKKKVEEALDPVGQEDKDIDNDGDHDKSDKYLLNRRKVRAKVIPPQEKLKTDRDMFNIPKSEQEAARERTLAKAKAKREKMKEEVEQIDEIAPLVAGGLALGGALAAGAAIKRAQNAAKSGVDAANKGKQIKNPGTGIAGAAYGMQRHNNALRDAMKQYNHYEPEGEMVEEDKEYRREMAKAAARERAEERREKGGKAAKSPGREGPSAGKSYADYQEISIKAHDKITKKNKNVVGLVAKEETEIEEGMTMKDFKQQRSRQKQKDKRESEKTSPLRRAGIHDDKASPERAARHRANVDPDYDHDDEENMYPGGKLKDPKKIRKAKATGELTKEEYIEEKSLSRAQQRFMGMVYAAKKGETPASPEVAKAASGMSKKAARDFAKTKHEGLPEKKEETKEELSLVQKVISEFSPLSEGKLDDLLADIRGEDDDKKKSSKKSEEERKTEAKKQVKRGKSAPTGVERAATTSAAGRTKAAEKTGKYKLASEQERTARQEARFKREDETRARKALEQKERERKEAEEAKKKAKQEHRKGLRQDVAAAWSSPTKVGSGKKDTSDMSATVSNLGNIVGGVAKTGIALGKYAWKRRQARKEEQKQNKEDQTQKEQFSNWREEFIFEVDDQSIQTEPQQKIIDVSKKKNKIEINPNMSEGCGCDEKEKEETPKKDMRELPTKVNLLKTKARSMGVRNPIVMVASEETDNIQEIAPLLAAVARVAAPAVARGVTTRVAGSAAQGTMRARAAEIIGQKAGEKMQNMFSGQPAQNKQTSSSNDEVQKPLGGIFAPEEVQNEDWQSVNRKDNTDGLSQKAVNAYRRENPGSKLQTAVTEKKPTGKRAERRQSFCRRMNGMKDKLTSAETSRDPDSRINKALRRWNCN
jgi:hypothetical protein